VKLYPNQVKCPLVFQPETPSIPHHQCSLWISELTVDWNRKTKNLDSLIGIEFGKCRSVT
jgi:hypothetical protein